MLAELNTIAKNYEYLIKAVGAFLPFLIAIFMAYVAYQQWQTNERQRKKELFEDIYEFLYKKPFELLKELPEKMKDAKSIDSITEVMNSYDKYRSFVPNNKFKELRKIFNKGAIKIAELIDFKINSQQYQDFIEKTREEYYQTLEPYLRIEEARTKTIWEIIIYVLKWIYSFLALDKINLYIIFMKIQTYLLQVKLKILEKKLNKYKNKKQEENNDN